MASDSRRRGRRERVAARAERQADGTITPAHGGRYRPLTDADCARIHDGVLDILETVGMAEAPADVVATVTAAGGRIEDGRLMFPRPLVQRALEGLSRSVTLHGQRPGLELELGGDKVYLGTGGAAPQIVDLETGAYRDSTLADLHDAARLVDALENVHFFSRSLVARDIADARALDLNTAFACLVGTAKHIMVSAAEAPHVEPIAQMAYAAMGSEAAFRARPCLSLNVNHAVPPLRFSTEACGVIAEAVRLGLPVMMNTFGQLGASSPVTIAGSVAQTLAETLAGMIYGWLLDPAARLVFGPRPMVTDLRTGAMAGGGGEQALATAAAVQMARFYELPCSTIAGATDAKVADAQSGYEKCLSVALAAQAGAHLITQSCGMQAGLMGVSFESYVVDNDMLGAVIAATRPVEVSPETLSPGMIGEVVRGEGHFLGHAQTFQRMQSDFRYPTIADRRTPSEWEAAGGADMREVARARARQILAEPSPQHLDPAVERDLRARFNILLPGAALGR